MKTLGSESGYRPIFDGIKDNLFCIIFNSVGRQPDSERLLFFMKTVFYLMRHAESDYTDPMRWKAPGWGADLAPLSAKGKEQIRQIIPKIRAINPDILLTSSTARTLETTLHIIKEFPVKFAVEFDLHEWVPDKNFRWRSLEEILEIQKDFDSHGGEHPAGTEKSWESFSMMRKRLLNVLEKYTEFEKVFVICHGMVMQTLTGKEKIKNTEILEFQIDSEET